MTTEQLKMNITNVIKGISLYVMVKVLADEERREKRIS
jgi:hypothetical protein